LPEPGTTLAEMVRRALARNPHRPAIEFEGVWHSWGELSRQADRVTDLLQASCINDDAPVAFVPRNRPSSIATLLALLATGRTVRMIYSFQSAEAIARDIVRLTPAAVIVDAMDLAAPIVETLAMQGMAGIVLDACEINAMQGAERASGDNLSKRGPDDPLIEILTSGTTGPPKQFPIRHQMIADSFIARNALDARPQEESAELPPALLYFPLGNISGIYSTVPTLVRGQRACLLDRFSIAQWHAYVVRHRPVQTGVPPAAMRALLDADIPAEDLASIKIMGAGAAPLDPSLQRAFEERYGIPILISYGATEFGGPVCAWSAELHAEWGSSKLGSVGRPIHGAQIRIVDPENGKPVDVGAEGRLEVISPRIGHDWIKTADIGMLDEDGFLFLRGRADGAIIRGGFKILPETIERALLAHETVVQVAIVDVPDSRLGQVPAAAVQLGSNPAADPAATLEKHLRSLLPATHIPVHWHFAEALPYNASMKIDRPAIRHIFKALLQRRT
jgi:long-chain acyl-CoA synthetase